MTRVLVVDDSPIDRLLAGNLLAQNGGWTVEYASDGQEGLDAIRSQRPDLVVTDMQMPEMNGLELACTVRREFPNVSIILMTARGSEEIALEALQAGATSYVPKRALGQRLVETARRVLSARHEDTVQREVLKRLNVRESYSMENNLELLLSLSRYLQLTLAHQWGLDLSTRLQIGMALEEAMMNAMHHGNLELDASLKETDEAVYFHMAQQRCHEPRYCDRRIEVEMRLIPQVANRSRAGGSRPPLRTRRDADARLHGRSHFQRAGQSGDAGQTLPGGRLSLVWENGHGST
jgi:CheY-like chemotaxis protein